MRNEAVHYQVCTHCESSCLCIMYVCYVIAQGGEDTGGEATSPLNILLVGSGDLRHVLTTLASTTRPVHVRKSVSSRQLLIYCLSIVLYG